VQIHSGRLTKFILNRLLVIGAALMVVLAVLRTFENRFIFFPPRYPEGFPAPGNYPRDLEEIWISTTDGVRLNAWFRPNPASSKVLLWFHGNATNIGRQMGELETYSRLGLGIFALDYRGYGKSEGSPDEAGVYHDAEAAYRYLTEQRRFPPKSIVVYGHSLGGAVAVDLASRHPCGGLIVESSFTNTGEMARMMFHLPLIEYLPRSRFDSLAKIGRVRAPILVIHGTRDPTIPFSMGGRLYDAAPEPRTFLPIDGGEHNALFIEGGERYWKTLQDFVDGIKATAGEEGKS
jgi:fermentation-respiration switch protein FrsA (DUF1100 family)